MSEIDNDALTVLVEAAEDLLAEYGFSQPDAENARQLAAIRAGHAALGTKSRWDGETR